MRTAAALLPLALLCACATPRRINGPGPGPIPLITDLYPSPDGTRSLELRGLFVGADTVLVQVYHDSDVLYEDVRTHTWSLTLGTYDWYSIKFTAQGGSEKYLHIHELCDGAIEYVPEIVIDFNRTGNLILYKPSDGKPDFLQLDVGLSRRAVRP